uniref:Uncharacterized protein n=1 Tax=Acrobeloides nanus TaxID=290746 RepID=A0A914EQ29_9BILA
MVVWVTVINPISAILFVEPYRKAILTFIGIGHNKVRMQVGGIQQIAFVDTYEMKKHSRPDRPSTQLKDFIVRKEYLGITGFGGMDDLEIRNGRVRRQAWMENKMFY